MGMTTMRPNTNLNDYLHDEVTEKGYAYKNQQLAEVPLSDPFCCAKHIHTKNPNLNSNKYFLLVGQDHSLYNPTETGQRRIQDTVGSRPYWNWKNVEVATFDMYLTFLKTKNNHYYRTATHHIQVGQ